MMAFLQANIYNFTVGGIILLIVFLIVKKIIKDKKTGKGSCGCGCDCTNCKGCSKSVSNLTK